MTASPRVTDLAADPPPDRRAAAGRGRGAASIVDPFPGDSDMAARCRTVEWAATPLGPPAGWPAALRTAVRLMLGAPVPTSLWVGPAYTLLYNDAYAGLIGANHPAALGRPGANAWAAAWPAFAPRFDAIRAGGPPDHAAEAFIPASRLPGGAAEDAWFTYGLSALTDEDGDVLAVYNVAVEVTGRVLAEREGGAARDALAAERARLRSVILDMPTPLALLEGPEHRFTLVNDAYKRVSGGGRDITGLTPREAFPEVAGQGIHELFDQVYASGAPWAGPETLVRYDRDGTGVTDVWFNARIEPVRDADGRVVGLLNFNVDVTEQVRARREVEGLLAASEGARADAEAARGRATEAQGAAEVASRAKGEFLAVMSHELRTPLNAIGGYAELMEMGLHGPVTDAQRTALGRIQKSQRALLSLINEVLNYARLETGAVTYDLADVPVAEAVAEAEVLVAPQLRAKGLGYAAACAPAPDGRPMAVRADRDKLQQVLRNLLSNAIKFTNVRPGLAGRIDVTCAADPAGWVAIRVRDTGIGIAADKLEAVFDPFVQVDQALTRTQQGTGLGLAISRDLTRGMGGDLTVESEVGVGSTFTIALPAAI